MTNRHNIKIVSEGIARTHYIPTSPTAIVVLAHGAGAGNQHPFMTSFASQLAELGVLVISFNFPYMQIAYEQEKRRPPNKLEILLSHFNAELALVENNNSNGLPVFVVGKSMGGRIASMLACDSTNLKGVCALGYPFIPPGKPEKLAGRIAHFDNINIPFLVQQGERDTFGDKSLLSSLMPLPNVRVTWIPDGDHGFKPRKKSGFTEEDNIKLAVHNVTQFIEAER